jgi:drug/metabolite transporter (DMT)-like permease
MKNGLLIYLSLLLVTIFWGGSFSAIKHLLGLYTPMELVVARFIPAAFIFALISIAFYPKESLKMLKEDFLKTFLVGLLGIPAYHLCLNNGETHISAGLASLIIGLNPTFTFIASSIFLKEKPTILRIAGLIVSFIGLFILVKFGSGLELNYSYLMAVFLTVLSPAAWALYTITSKPLTLRHSPMVVASVTTVIGTIPVLFLIDRTFITKSIGINTSFALSLGFLSILSTVIGNIVWMAAIKKISATRVSSFVYLSPFFAVIIGILFLHESMNFAFLIGGLFILGGVALVNLRKKSNGSNGS